MIYFMIVGVYMTGMFLAYGEKIEKRLSGQKIKDFAEKGSNELSKWIVKNKREIPDRELFRSSIILKNLSLVRRESPFSADYIYEKLMENSGYLRPMYAEMLSLYRSGRDDEASRVPVVFVGTKAAKNFALILSKLDKLNPDELVQQMSIFQDSMIEKQVTYAVKRVQRNSIIISALSATSVFALLINFVVVVVFMDSLSMISSMFI
ncbi:MAG: hypothetical protein DBY08_00470 [Clostridiales bacterium]|nr:hypothetical protein [Anaerovoracaceae bacterium]PWL95335.1 MAG: hypothetical protein DBY08_00470 [Clostridiales bacterium]